MPSNATSHVPQTGEKDPPGQATDRLTVAISVVLLTYAGGAPHSIWLAQASSLVILVLWTIRWRTKKTSEKLFSIPGFVSLITFFGLTLISALTSFEPRQSLDGMRGILFMGMFVVVARTISGPVLALWLMALMLVSAQVNVLLTFSQEVLGIGFRITKITDDSPFKGRFEVGDVIYLMNGKRVQSPEDIFWLSSDVTLDQTLHIEGRRVEIRISTDLPNRAIIDFMKIRINPDLGLSYEPARDFRAKGFYNHYATYAEMLQILISMAIGLYLGLPRGSPFKVPCGLFILTMLAALWFTYTRAPLGGLAVSAVVMILASVRFRIISMKASLIWMSLFLIASAAAIGFAYSTRKMSVADQREGSLFWRLVVWQEGLELVKRHPVLGIGRGSDKIHAADWGLYAAGDLPPGHFHNTYLQVAVWYGIPALVVYLCLLTFLFSGLWKQLRSFSDSGTKMRGPPSLRGVVLGALGALTGFCVSSMVHFNLGDGEVAMTLWLVLGAAFSGIEKGQKKGALKETTDSAYDADSKNDFAVENGR